MWHTDSKLVGPFPILLVDGLNPFAFTAAQLGITWGFHPNFKHYNTNNYHATTFIIISLHILIKQDKRRMLVVVG